MSVTRGTAAKSAMWSAVESGGLSFLSFISLIAYSRLLSPSDFGLYATVWALVELFSTLSSMAFHDALVQRPEATARHFDTAFTVTLALSVFFLLVCLLAAPAFARLMHDPKAGEVLSWLGLNFIFSGFASVVIAKQRREFGFRMLAMRSIVGRVSGAIIGIGCAVFGLGIWSLVIQQLLMTLFGSMTLWIASTGRPRFRFGWTEFKELGSFGLVAVTALFLNFGVKRLFVFYCGVFLGTNLAGFLNLAFRTIDTFWAITATAISQVALPVMSRLQNDPERLRRAYDAAVGVTCTLLYPAFLGLGTIAPEFVELLFGKTWLPSAGYICALTVLVFSQAQRIFSAPLLTASGRPGDVLKAYGIGLLFIVIAIAATRLPSGEVAIAIWGGCELLYFTVFSFLLRRATGIALGDQLGSALRPFLATMVMVCCSLLCRLCLPADAPVLLRTALLVTVGALSYGAAMSVLDRPSLLRVISLFAAWKKPERLNHA